MLCKKLRCQFLFRIIKAAMTPGIQPKQVKIKTMRIDPQPRSNTANGGKMMDNITLNNDMIVRSYSCSLRRYKNPAG